MNRVTDAERRKIIGGASAFVAPPTAGDMMHKLALDAIDHEAEIARLRGQHDSDRITMNAHINEIELLRGELKASEDGSGITNVVEQHESILKAERAAHLATAKQREEARADRDKLRAEIADAMAVLNPNMPESGLVDACKQRQQGFIAARDNSDEAVRQLDKLRVEVEEAVIDEREQCAQVALDFKWQPAGNRIAAAIRARAIIDAARKA